MGEFTKLNGPWEVSRFSGKVSISTAHSGRRMVLFPSGGKLQSCNDKGVLEPLSGDEFHLQIIAASPDMYEALEAVKNTMEGTFGMIDLYPDEYQQIKAALTKANPNGEKDEVKS